MASTRKSRTANKRFSKLNEESPHKDGESAKTKARKKKLSDMLGSQWSKEELERFYEAYRKHGKDWKKVSGVIRNRSADMVESLYNMNKAYLSLEDGVATAAGLIAMMTDHYNILEGSESDHESNDEARTSSKPQKRGRGKFRLNVGKSASGSYPDLLQHQSTPSNSGCLPLLKKKHYGGFAGSQPRAVGKRTPRFPVSYISDKVNGDRIFHPKRHCLKTENDADDDEGAHVAALALAEGFQRGGSPQVSCTPGSKMDDQSKERKYAESEIANSKLNSVHMDEECWEGSLGSREAENEGYARDSNHIHDSESAGIVASKLKARRLKGKRPRAGAEIEYDDGREACSGTEEGLNAKSTRDEMITEFTDEKGPKSSNGQRKRSRKLFFGDESTALDALQTLADISLNILMPPPAVESESSALAKEDKKNFDAVEKPVMTGKIPKNNQKDKAKISRSKEKCCQPTVGNDVVKRKTSKFQKTSMLDSVASSEVKQEDLPISKVQKRKRKLLEEKVPKSEANVESHLDEVQRTEVSAEEGKKLGTKARRSAQVIHPSKQSKSAKPSDNTSSSTDMGRTNIAESAQISTANEVHLPIKANSRRKMSLQKVMAWKGLKSSEGSGENLPKTMDLKEKFSHCLLSPLLRRWCTFEWFYSAIDYPWFAKSEFVEYLNHVGLGHVPRLTRVEWGVIRSSLGKPRRLSQQFLQEEREKLEQYRESVRTHYAELRAGIREGLPADLARPLSVGQRVIACHPKTREIHDGSVLTVDRNRCRVQFDRPELGVEFVMDIDCMPLNPLENMPDALRKRNLVGDSLFGVFSEMKPYDHPKDWKPSGASTVTSSMEYVDGSAHCSNYPMNTLMKQAKGDTIDAIAEAKAAANEVAIATRQALYTQPCTLAQIQAREDDIRALSELTRALDKKEALLIELRYMNEEVSLKQKEGESLKDFDHFRKQYAMVLLQLRDANNLVASALLYLRQRNTYLGNSTPPRLRPLENSNGMAGPPGTFSESCFNRDSRSHVVEIVESSRQKAKGMVDIAVQAISSLKEGEDPFAKVGEALDSTKKWTGVDSTRPPVKPFHATDRGHGNSTCQDQATSCTLKSTAPTDGHDTKPQISDRNSSQIPSDLISSCVSTFIMIQRCTERQYPPAEVAQILESAVLSLMPCCPQNMPLYRDIEDCMGYIKQQMLALVPSSSTTALPMEHPAG